MLGETCGETCGGGAFTNIEVGEKNQEGTDFESFRGEVKVGETACISAKYVDMPGFFEVDCISADVMFSRKRWLSRERPDDVLNIKGESPYNMHTQRVHHRIARCKEADQQMSFRQMFYNTFLEGFRGHI